MDGRAWVTLGVFARPGGGVEPFTAEALAMAQARAGAMRAPAKDSRLKAPAALRLSVGEEVMLLGPCTLRGRPRAELRRLCEEAPELGGWPLLPEAGSGPAWPLGAEELRADLLKAASTPDEARYTVQRWRLLERCTAMTVEREVTHEVINFLLAAHKWAAVLQRATGRTIQQDARLWTAWVARVSLLLQCEALEDPDGLVRAEMRLLLALVSHSTTGIAGMLHGEVAQYLVGDELAFALTRAVLAACQPLF